MTPQLSSSINSAVAPPRGQVQLLHQFKEQRIAYGTDQPPCSDTRNEGFQKIRRAWWALHPHARAPQVNPEALVEVDAISCHHPFTEFDDSASRMLVGRDLMRGTMRRESFGTLGGGHGFRVFFSSRTGFGLRWSGWPFRWSAMVTDSFRDVFPIKSKPSRIS